MKKMLPILLAVALIFSLVACSVTTDAPDTQADNQDEASEKKAKPTVVNYFGKPDEELELEIITAFEAENPNIKINYTALTGGSNDKLKTVQTVLQAQDDSIDVFAADAAWPYIFTAANWVTAYDDIKGALDGDFLKDYMTVSNFQHNGKTYGIPFQVNVGTLYYRKDLLEKYNQEIPETWEKLVKVSKVIMEGENNPDLYGYGCGWKQSEGLACAAYEYMWPNGVNIVENGQIDIDVNQLEESIRFMVDLMKEGISPKEMPSFSTSDVRGLYKAGNLIFARDWATGTTKHFLNPEGNEYHDKTGVTVIPGGHGTLGNWGLMISKYSKNKEAAAKFAKFRASKVNLLLQNAQIGALPSTISAYENATLEENLLRYRDSIFEVIQTSKPRPITPFYGEISQVVQLQVHSALTGLITPKQAAELIEKEVTRILN